MSPEQQLVEMKALEEERQSMRGKPSERDLEVGPVHWFRVILCNLFTMQL